MNSSNSCFARSFNLICILSVRVFEYSRISLTIAVLSLRFFNILVCWYIVCLLVKLVLCCWRQKVDLFSALCDSCSVYRELHLNNNLLRVLPFELGKLFQLQTLGLKGITTFSWYPCLFNDVAPAINQCCRPLVHKMLLNSDPRCSYLFHVHKYHYSGIIL